MHRTFEASQTGLTLAVGSGALSEPVVSVGCRVEAPLKVDLIVLRQQQQMDIRVKAAAA